VILELGFFLGKLGRERVCALYKSGVELPSDFSGVLWVSMDDR
jgi:predicted nucleotide-binding protein